MSDKPVVLFDIDYTLFDTALFKNSNLTRYTVYGEVIDVLDKLKSIAELGIFSKGESEFQRDKLKNTNIGKFFKEFNTHIFLNKEDNLKQVLDNYNDRKILLVDDKLPVLQAAKLQSSLVIAIWLKRGPFAQNQKEIPGFKPDFRIDNLSEVVRIVQSV